MKSMTGFGTAELKKAPHHPRLKVEISSINSKRGLDLIINLPRTLIRLELPLRELIESSLKRGRVVFQLHLGEINSNTNSSQAPCLIDEKILNRYRKDLKKLAGEWKQEAPDLEYILTLPGVLKPETETSDEKALEAAILRTTEKAVKQLLSAKKREGTFLASELKKSCAKIQVILQQIEKRRPQVLTQYRENLLKRIADANVSVDVDDDRLLKELAFFADRSDITEETTRLASHLAEMKRLFSAPDTNGRTLDFMIQEIGREINTIGSKANDFPLSQNVVLMKTELEKIREQVQNIE